MRHQPETMEEYEEMKRKEQEEQDAADAKVRVTLWLGLILAILIGTFAFGLGGVATVDRLSHQHDLESQSMNERQP